MLADSPVKRFFAFGCSFTSYHWPMWPDIVKHELGDVEYHNFGMCGAGNQFIAHSVYNANETYNFGPEDLVMICWSSAFRNDWYINSDWKCEGNAFYPGYYNSLLNPSLTDLNHYTIRDAGVIAGCIKFLEGLTCQSHNICIIDNFVSDDQDHGFIEQEILDHPECKPLVNYIKEHIRPSFWDMGYDIDFNKNLWSELPQDIRDDHPIPSISLEYLSRVLDHDFNPHTVEITNQHTEKLWEVFKRFPTEFQSEDCPRLYLLIEQKFPELSQLS